MSNSYFRFKQFCVQQDRCAMKVSTDACIQGAWTPLPAHGRTVLDVGCGTGLLSLMLAQRDPALTIDSVELDEPAARQADENVAASPWAQQVRVIHADVRHYQPKKKYDLIICNPPFFHNSLHGKADNRNRARHSLTLTQEALLRVIVQHLDAPGYACIMLPPVEHALWAQLLAKNGWHLHRTLSVRPDDEKKVNRIISLAAAFPPQDCTEETLSVYSAGGGYTPAFTALLQPYYLYL